MKYLEIFWSSLAGFWGYFFKELITFKWDNFYHWFIGVSLLFLVLEIARPWRKDQPVIRQDFWLDTFYMFFNIMILSLIGYNALNNAFSVAFDDVLNALFGITNLVAVKLHELPQWAYVLTMFLMSDFLGYWIHRLLHRVPFLWNFHKVHHSVKEMGFAAHLRYHWMENFVYNGLRYIPLAMCGFYLGDLMVMHIFNLAWGHFNHANFKIPLGPLKYIFNNPEMHIWHHSKKIPEGRYGVNFGLTLSVWDYIFGTDHIPHDGRDIELGFGGDEEFPKDFAHQVIYPVGKE